MQTDSNARDGAGEPPSRPPDRRVTAPAWVPSEDGFAGATDRQVLVAGDTVAGLTLAHLLEHAGYDPLLAVGDGVWSPSRLAYLWPPTLRVLAAVDAEGPVLDRARVVDSVSARRTGAGSTGPARFSRVADGAAAPPVVVPTSALRRTLRGTLPERIRLDRTVETLSRRDDGLTAEFDGGVREWFDAVVDAGAAPPALGPAGTAPRDTDVGATLDQYETVLGGDDPAPNRLRDAWWPGLLVQHLPHPGDGGRLLRVTTAGQDPEAALAEAGPGGPVTGGGPDPEAVAAALARAEPAGRRQVRLPPAAASPARWGRGRIARCGGAVCPLAPASGFRASVAIEDALAFVSRLARGPRSTAGAVDAYARDRARRVGTIRTRARAALPDHGYPVPDGDRSRLAALGVLRTVALGPFLGGPLPTIQRDGFE